MPLLEPIDEIQWAAAVNPIVAQLYTLFRRGELDENSFLRTALVLLVRQNKRLTDEAIEALRKQTGHLITVEKTDAPRGGTDPDQGRNDDQVRLHPDG